jgi:DNA-binding NtrC family response regulator
MSEQCSIIIVDDNEMLLDMLQKGLSLEGYTCTTVTNAALALELLDKRSFDIMIADIVLPDMNGLKLAQKAKTLRPEMAILIMTGFVEDFSYDKAIEAGASDFIKNRLH